MITAAAGHRTRWWTVVAFIVSDVCLVLAWVYFFVLNRTRIVRRYSGDDRTNLMVVSNHQSPFDTLLIALAAFSPRLLFRPQLHPWSIAAAEYWFSNPVITWLARHLRCIPARAGVRDASAVRSLCRVLPGGMTVFFPEGCRSPDGSVGRGRAGAGFVVHATRARIVPVAIDGLLAAMPYHAPRPRIGKRFTIAFGDPVPCEDLLARPATREATQAIVDRAMAAVSRLLAQVRSLAPGPQRASHWSGFQSGLTNGRRGEGFRDKVVWITGASSGIGRALALALHRQRAVVILSARNAVQLEAVAAECTGNADVHVLPLDLAAREALPDRARTALRIAGRIDYVIHNAGIAARDLAVDTLLDIDRHVMETNYFGPIALTKLILPSMLRRRSGGFVVISSLSGKYGIPRMGAYCASKHALHGFFESLRSEVRGHNIQVSIAVPGFINTPITVNALTGTGARFGKRMLVHLGGMEAADCAARILAAVAARKEEFVVGGVEVLSVGLLRVSRRLVAALVRNHPFRFQENLVKYLFPGRYRMVASARRRGEDIAPSW